MQDSKDINWGSDIPRDATADTQTRRGTADQKTEAAAVADGWQQYRRWISKAPAPRTRNAGVDPSLYTWKGYRNWTEQVKRDWSEN